MAKKSQWKKAIRAEVAAALQNQTTGQPAFVPSGVQSNPSTQKNPTSHNQVMTATGNDLVILSDLRRIFWVALVLFALLVTTTITDRKNHWLDRFATTISHSVTK